MTARKGYDMALREIPKEAKKGYTPCFSKLKRAIDEHESLTRERDLIKKRTCLPRSFFSLVGFALRIHLATEVLVGTSDQNRLSVLGSSL